MAYESYSALLNKFYIGNIEKHLQAIALRSEYSGLRPQISKKLLSLVDLCLPWAARNKLRTNKVVICPNDQSVFKSAKNYIRKYELFNPESVVSRYSFDRDYHTKLPKIDSIRLWYKMLWLAVQSIFDSRASTDVFVCAYRILNTFLGDQKNIKIYIYGRLYQVEYYIAALLLSEVCGLRVTYLIGSGIIYSNKRYTYLPKVDMVAGSIVQVEEIRSLEKQNYFNSRSLHKWGSINETTDSTVKHRTYDIGIYSSGEWARKNGLLRENDINKIIAGLHLTNSRYRVFRSVMEQVVTEFFGLRIKLYMHPFERSLFAKGIIPPYYHFLRNCGVEIDSEMGGSIERIHECSIGISLISTIIYERWDCGLGGYIYNDPDATEKNRLFDPDFLGKFSSFVYSSPEDLVNKLRKDNRIERIH